MKNVRVHSEDPGGDYKVTKSSRRNRLWFDLLVLVLRDDSAERFRESSPIGSFTSMATYISWFFSKVLFSVLLAFVRGFVVICVRFFLLSSQRSCENRFL